MGLAGTGLTFENFGARKPFVFNPRPQARAPSEEGLWKGGDENFLFQPVRTEWGQQTPASGMGGGTVALYPFVATNNDVPPTPFMMLDGWKPLYNEKWFHVKSAQDMLERRMNGRHGEVDTILHENRGVTYQTPGALNVLPTVQPGLLGDAPWEH